MVCTPQSTRSLADPPQLPELVLYSLSWSLRSKPDWQRKFRDPEIRAKWRTEAMEEAKKGDESEYLQDGFLDEKTIDYVFAELEGYIKIADNEKCIERAAFEGIWHSDKLFSPEYAERLRTAVRVLEDVPDDKKDWHPGSNGQVLDLIHPSLYCVVYNRTHAYLPGKPRISENFLPVEAPKLDAYSDQWVSNEFCWMPSDFAVDENGVVKLVSPYINNLHPKQHQSLYPIIEEAIAGFVPMWERVLGDVNRENGKDVAWHNTGRMEHPGCVWGAGGKPYQQEDCPSDEEDEEAWYEKFLAAQPKEVPQANEYAGQLEARYQPVSLRGRKIQCIIKLANIHLTPENPKYQGGQWHVEGMVNECIAASGIYYYDEDNIDESQLSFRVATGQPEYHGQDDSECMNILYGMDRDSECVQDIGAIVTKSGRALAWPNVFQHCVSEFKLADATKPGHRKILAVFLVDPTADPICSATHIPPQQAEWAAEALEDAFEAKGTNGSPLPHMPRELRDLVKSEFPQSVMTLKEAEEYRLKLMKERTAFVEDHTSKAISTFNMCEH
ncbi:hypothetical protein MKEN_01486800 [Mycena kentingensis (nom. inval.)]|nr:hypothetical protein MKEN_01486800 [Mycena kentingensis (nom. inval.)]